VYRERWNPKIIGFQPGLNCTQIGFVGKVSGKGAGTPGMQPINGNCSDFAGVPTEGDNGEKKTTMRNMHHGWAGTYVSHLTMSSVHSPLRHLFSEGKSLYFVVKPPVVHSLAAAAVVRF
jgi:hypothetical protein